MLSNDKLHKIKSFRYMPSYSSNALTIKPKDDPLVQTFLNVEDLLGQGTNAKVYKATSKPGYDIHSLKKKKGKNRTMKPRVYAVKIMKTRDEIKSENSGRSSAVDEVTMFEHEIKVMRKIKEFFPRHPNIVHLVQVCLSDDALNPPKRPCLVIEFLPGGELFDKIVEKSFFSEQDAAALFLPLMQALTDLHDKGIVHRDLKPENLVFGASDDVLKICDFGTAKIMSEPGEDIFREFKVGSPGYFAPETIYKSYHPANDVWSMGCILYTLLVGYMPFNMDDPMLIVKLLTCRYDFPAESWSSISEEAKELIRKMLSMPYLERISAEQVVQHDWFKLQRKSDDGKKTQNNANLAETLVNLKALNQDKEKKRQINRQYFFDNLLTARAKVTKVLQRSSSMMNSSFKKALTRTTSLSSQGFAQMKRSVSRRDVNMQNPKSKLQVKLKHTKPKNRQALLTDIRSTPHAHKPSDDNEKKKSNMFQEHFVN